MPDVREALVRGVVDRARNLLLALDRQDRLESAGAFVGWLGQTCEQGQLEEPAQELLLRAMRVAGDPVNYDILQRLDPITPVELPELMKATGLHRVAASERVNDLVQVGLAVRDLINDHVRGTSLSAGLVELVGDITAAAAVRLDADLRKP